MTILFIVLVFAPNMSALAETPTPFPKRYTPTPTPEPVFDQQVTINDQDFLYHFVAVDNTTLVFNVVETYDKKTQVKVWIVIIKGANLTQNENQYTAFKRLFDFRENILLKDQIWQYSGSEDVLRHIKFSWGPSGVIVNFDSEKWGYSIEE